MSPSSQRIAGHPHRSRRTAQVRATSVVPPRQPRRQRVVLRSDARPRRDWSQMLTTLIALGALVFTGVSVMQTGRQNTQQDDLAAQGQITDRYTAAVDQIGSPTLDVRLGGIYALERIMLDSPADQPTIVEVLSAFVRDHSPGVTPPANTGWPWGTPADRFSGAVHLPTDVAAALTVLGRRNTAHDGASVEDLRDVNFAEVDLSFISLPNADLTDANLTFANLTDTDLHGARMFGTDLTSTIMDSANLDHANLQSAILNYADLDGTSMIGADLRGAAMIDTQVGAYLVGANLTDANLQCASLGNEDLTRTDLTSANLTGANLEGANLADVGLDNTDLTNANLIRANMAGTWLCPASVPSKPNLGYDC